MAEGGIVERLFGGGEGEDGGEGEVFSHPVADAVAMDEAGGSDEARAYLRDARLLIAIQTEHLHEQRAVQLDHLKLRRVAERMRVALQFFLVLVGTVIAFAFLWMVWNAAHDRGLVVEAFSVPPDLAARGLTGEVVAKQVLDRLSDMQAQTQTMRAAGSYQNNWGEDLKVEIPETGVSIGDVRRYLRATLGHETHISGEIYRTPVGVAVSARAGDDGAKTFSGADADLDKLIGEAAEAVYARTQPYRYAIYLSEHSRQPEANVVLGRLLSSNDPKERAWAHGGLAFAFGNINDFEHQAAQMRAALAEVPGFAPALENIAVTSFEVGHDADVVRFARASLHSGTSWKQDVSNQSRAEEQTAPIEYMDYVLGDYQAALQADGPLRVSVDAGSLEAARAYQAVMLAFDHDPAAARRAASQLDPSNGYRYFVEAITALDQGDPSGVSVLLKIASADLAKPNGRELVLREDAYWLAPAQARFGDLTGAEATIAPTPLDCYPCLRARGTVASYAGHRAEAERWFAEAIRQAANLPKAYVERGQARFRAGDLDGALADAKAGVKFGPHYADAYGLLGDVLARQHRWAAARSKYDEALKYAPAWPAARRARDEVAQRA